MTPTISAVGHVKAFGSTRALDELDLTVRLGEVNLWANLTALIAIAAVLAMGGVATFRRRNLALPA